MREIKFRVWDSKRKRFLEHYEFIIEFNGTVSNVDYVEIGTTNKGAVLETFTGLKDKNGVEIYENDILKSSGGNIEVVIYIDGRFEPVCWYGGKNYEVIGNVHQNADLLAADIERMIPDDIGNDIHEFLHGGEK